MPHLGMELHAACVRADAERLRHRAARELDGAVREREAVPVRVHRLEALRQDAEHGVVDARRRQLGLVEAGERLGRHAVDDAAERVRERLRAEADAEQRRARRRPSDAAPRTPRAARGTRPPRRRSACRRRRAPRRSPPAAAHPACGCPTAAARGPSSTITSPKSSGCTSGPCVTVSTIMPSAPLPPRAACAAAARRPRACATPSVWLLLLKNAYASSAWFDSSRSGGDPFAQLVLRVEVVEAVRGRSAARVPRRRVAAVEADVRDRRRRGDERRGHVPRVDLRGVDDDPASCAAPRASAAARRECRRRTTTGAAARTGTRPRRPGRAPTRGSRATTASRRRTAASGRGCRRASRTRAAASSALEELAEDGRARLARRAVDAAARVDRQALAQVGRHLLELHRVARHQPERLDVHHEAVRRAVGPALHHLLGRDAVVRRVDLDGREALGVVGEALLRRRARRVPVLREGVVRPRARPDPDRRRHRVRIERGPRSGPSLVELAARSG